MSTVDAAYCNHGLYYHLCNEVPARRILVYRKNYVYCNNLFGFVLAFLPYRGLDACAEELIM
jgi:hypothetical protein